MMAASVWTVAVISASPRAQHPQAGQLCWWWVTRVNYFSTGKRVRAIHLVTKGEARCFCTELLWCSVTARLWNGTLKRTFLPLRLLTWSFCQLDLWASCQPRITNKGHFFGCIWAGKKDERRKRKDCNTFKRETFIIFFFPEKYKCLIYIDTQLLVIVSPCIILTSMRSGTDHTALTENRSQGKLGYSWHWTYNSTVEGRRKKKEKETCKIKPERERLGLDLSTKGYFHLLNTFSLSFLGSLEYLCS